MQTTERRYTQLIEARAAVDPQSQDLVLSGYATVFDQESELWPGMVEVFRRGCFAETLQRDDQLAYWAHNCEEPLARKSAGTLSLEEDARGLKVEIRMANTVINQNRYASVQRGDVKGMSIGFIAQPDGQVFSVKQSGTELREITRAILIEVSPHPDPQFTQTELEARAKSAFAACKREPEPETWRDEIAVAEAQANLLSFDL